MQRGFDLPRKRIRPGDVPIVYSNGPLGTHNQAMAKAPGIVTGRSGTIGNIHFIERDFWPHNTALWVTSFCGNVPQFVRYLLDTVDLASLATGSGVPTLNRNDVHVVRVALPESPVEQAAIAEALSDVDEAIASQEAVIAKKRALKTATMQALLSATRRLPGFSGEWEVKALGQCLKVRHGKSQAAVESVNGKYPILATGGEIGRADAYLHPGPSVLIGRKGTIDRPQYSEGPFWSIDTLFYTEVDASADAKFLFYKFQMIDWRTYNEASGVPSLSSTTIEAIEVEMPKRDEQTAIAAVISDFDLDLYENEAKLAKLQNLKTGMMQQLLTGKIRLV
jgi:type I restriction enzyme S subunit